MLRGVPTAETLAAVLEKARDRCPDPACIVWTGDLSHKESVAGYRLLRELAGDWIEKSHAIQGTAQNRVKIHPKNRRASKPRCPTQMFDSCPAPREK